MILPVRALAVLGTAAASVYAATEVLPELLPEGADAVRAEKRTAVVEPPVRRTLTGVKTPSGITLSGLKVGAGEKKPGFGFAFTDAFEPVDDKLEARKRRFGYEARVYFHSNAGEFSTGRLAGLSGRSGAYSLFSTTGDALGGASPVRTGLFRFPVMNNVLAFRTRTINGVTAYAMHSFGVDDLDSGRVTGNDRYVGLGLDYETAGGAVALTLEQGLPSRTRPGVANPVLIGLAANKGDDKLRFYGAIQYGRHLTDDIAADDSDYLYRDGTNLAGTIGVRYGLEKGELRLAAYHGRADFSGVKRNTTGIGLRASGTIAPNTYGWLTAGVSRTEVAKTDRRHDRLNVHTGLTHVF